MKKNKKDFINEIRTALKGLPADTIDEAVGYYEELLEDYLEEGLSEQESIGRLGSVEDIVRTIKAELRITAAEKHPGPLKLVKSYFSVAALRTPRIMAGLGPLAVAGLLYLLSIAVYSVMVGSLALSVNGIGQIRPLYIWGIIGMVGVGVFFSGVSGLLGYCIWKCADYSTALSMKVLRKRLGRKKIRITEKNGIKRRGTGKVLRIFIGIILFGTVLIIPSGLPSRYLSIWNSFMPSTVHSIEKSFKTSDIRKIFIKTLNSKINVEKTDTKNISIIYKGPDWMNGTISRNNKTLTFVESSNGRLPYMNFISRHEGMTSVTVLIPEGYKAQDIHITTNGGSVQLKGFEKDISISAQAAEGKITVGGNSLSGDVYTRSSGSGTVIHIKDTYGVITIE